MKTCRDTPDHRQSRGQENPCVRERERECVCVCVRERERERKRERERERWRRGKQWNALLLPVVEGEHEVVQVATALDDGWLAAAVRA